jgi:hypothetical protein
MITQINKFEELGPLKGQFVAQLLDFLNRSESLDKRLDVHLTDIIKALSAGKAVLWIAQEEEKMIGFSISELIQTVDGKKQCFISYAYSKDQTFSIEGLSTILKWAKENQCDSVNFITRRHSGAYERLLRRFDFKIKNVEFEVELWANHQDK